MDPPAGGSAPPVAALAGLAFAGLLTACSGLAVIANTNQYDSYTPGEWHGFDLPVFVQGTPFAVPQSETEQAVVHAMQGTTAGVPTFFAPATRGVSPAYRIVMVFTPPSGLDPYALCAARPEPPSAAFGGAPAERVELIAAFCRGDKAISTADGTIPTTGGPSGASFQRAISDFTIALLPMRNGSSRAGADVPRRNTEFSTHPPSAS